MAIRLSHTHANGKKCYLIGGRHTLTEAGLFKIGGGEVFAAGYKPYTGHWYAYDPETGAEIASFNREFFKRAIAQCRISSLVPDPDCVAA